MRCYICGETTSQEILITEKRYAIWADQEINVCKPCFELWSTEKYDLLDNKVANKLTLKRKKNA